jgi:hypothetical protein
MKPIFSAALWAATATLLSGITVDVKAQATYSLKAVEANPIPKAEHFQLWKEVALQACSDSKKRFNLAESECLAVIAKRAESCASQLSNLSPALITTTAAARDIGRKYMHCATPFYFCNGVEVKTEEEVRSKCK